MVKKCIVCNEEAGYKIKDSSDYYCQECAEENFADITMLINVEEEAQNLKAALKEKMEELMQKDEELDKILMIKEKKEEIQETEIDEQSNPTGEN